MDINSVCWCCRCTTTVSSAPGTTSSVPTTRLSTSVRSSAISSPRSTATTHPSSSKGSSTLLLNNYSSVSSDIVHVSLSCSVPANPSFFSVPLVYNSSVFEGLQSPMSWLITPWFYSPFNPFTLEGVLTLNGKNRSIWPTDIFIFKYWLNCLTLALDAHSAFSPPQNPTPRHTIH